MPSIEFTNSSVRFSGGTYAGSYTVYLKVNYSEDYNPNNNTTTITLDSVEAKSNANLGPTQFNGDGISFSANNSSWTNVTSNQWGHSSQVNLSSSYGTIGSVGGKTFNITHNSITGKATLYIKFTSSCNSTYAGSTGNFSNSGSKALTTHTVTLTIYPNGGVWNGSSSNQSFTQAPGSTKTITNATRTGYNFNGWTKGGSGLLSGTTYTFGGSNGTLTAGWNIQSYDLTTQASPQSAGTVTAGETLNYGATKELTATPSDIIGYTNTFVNWTLSGSGSLSSTTTNPTTFTMGAGNATVTANFTSTANKYYVKFNGNGSTGGSMANQEFTYDEASKALTLCAFVRSNYNFHHWNTRADDTGESYNDGEAVQNLATSGTLNLYAIWELQGFSVTYSANGHGTAPAAQIKPIGQDLILQSYIPNQYEDDPLETYVITANENGGIWSGENGQATSLPHHTYSQQEWNTSDDGTGESYDSLATYTVDSALSLYAIWDDSETRDYTYNVPTGIPTFSETRIIVFDKNGGDQLTVSSMAYGYRDCPFDGWYTEPSGGVARDSNSQVVSPETVYAHYEDTEFSTITTPAKNQCIRNHYELLGWAASSSATVPDYAPNVSIQPNGVVPIGFLLDTWSGGASGVTTMSKDISAWSTSLTHSDYFNFSGYVGVMYEDQPMVAYIEDSFYWLWPDSEPKVYNFEIMGESVTLTLTQTTLTLTTETLDPVVDLTFLKGGFMGQYLYAVWGAAGEVYIGGDKYKILIYDGANWGQYQAYIADGSQWVPY